MSIKTQYFVCVPRENHCWVLAVNQPHDGYCPHYVHLTNSVLSQIMVRVFISQREHHIDLFFLQFFAATLFNIMHIQLFTFTNVFL